MIIAHMVDDARPRGFRPVHTNVRAVGASRQHPTALHAGTCGAILSRLDVKHTVPSMRRSTQKYLPTPAGFSRDELSSGDCICPVPDDLPSFDF